METQWEVAWCDQYQRWFYAHRRHGISSWDRPRNCDLVLPSAPPPEKDQQRTCCRNLWRCRRRAPLAPSAPPLPDGWQAGWDYKYCDAYFYNMSTFERRWTRPGADATEIIRQESTLGNDAPTTFDDSVYYDEETFSDQHLNTQSTNHFAEKLTTTSMDLDKIKLEFAEVAERGGSSAVTTIGLKFLDATSNMKLQVTAGRAVLTSCDTSLLDNADLSTSKQPQELKSLPAPTKGVTENSQIGQCAVVIDVAPEACTSSLAGQTRTASEMVSEKLHTALCNRAPNLSCATEGTRFCTPLSPTRLAPLVERTQVLSTPATEVPSNSLTVPRTDVNSPQHSPQHSHASWQTVNGSDCSKPQASEYSWQTGVSCVGTAAQQSYGSWQTAGEIDGCTSHRRKPTRSPVRNVVSSSSSPSCAPQSDEQGQSANQPALLSSPRSVHGKQDEVQIETAICPSSQVQQSPDTDVESHSSAPGQVALLVNSEMLENMPAVSEIDGVCVDLSQQFYEVSNQENHSLKSASLAESIPDPGQSSAEQNYENTLASNSTMLPATGRNDDACVGLAQQFFETFSQENHGLKKARSADAAVAPIQSGAKRSLGDTPASSSTMCTNYQSQDGSVSHQIKLKLAPKHEVMSTNVLEPHTGMPGRAGEAMMKPSPDGKGTIIMKPAPATIRQPTVDAVVPQIERASPHKGGKHKGKGVPPGPPPKSKGKSQKGGTPGKGKGGSPLKPDIVTAVPLKRIFWNPIILESAQSPDDEAPRAEANEEPSIWERIHQKGASFDEGELETLFAEVPVRRRRTTTTNSSGSAADDRSSPIPTCALPRRLFDEKRHRKICFMVALLPDTSTLHEAILKMDASILSTENVELLHSNLPTPEEESMLSNTLATRPLVDNEAWDAPEAFMIKLITIPAYALRIRAWNSLNSFELIFTRLRQAREEMVSACSVLRNSARIEKLLAVILYVGNYLNSGTPRGRADGFDIETLVKVGKVKAQGGRAEESRQGGSLLDFIVKQIEQESPGTLREMFASGMEQELVRSARKHNLIELKDELSSFFTQVQSYLDRWNGDTFDNSTMLSRRVELAQRAEQLGDLHREFTELQDQYLKLVSFFKMDTERPKGTDCFFKIWDSFMEDVKKSLEAVQSKKKAQAATSDGVVSQSSLPRRSHRQSSRSRARPSTPRGKGGPEPEQCQQNAAPRVSIPVADDNAARYLPVVTLGNKSLPEAQATVGFIRDLS